MRKSKLVMLGGILTACVAGTVAINSFRNDESQTKISPYTFGDVLGDDGVEDAICLESISGNPLGLDRIRFLGQDICRLAVYDGNNIRQDEEGNYFSSSSPIYPRIRNGNELVLFGRNAVKGIYFQDDLEGFQDEAILVNNGIHHYCFEFNGVFDKDKSTKGRIPIIFIHD